MDALLRAMPHDFPICERPYREMAERIGISETDLISGLRDLKEQGLLRRVAAVLHHRKAAYLSNAMVVWKVEVADRERVGAIMASFPEVSHCYERETGGYWDYSLYTMVHSKEPTGCMETVQRIAAATEVKEFKIFFSKREFKKTSLSMEME